MILSRPVVVSVMVLATFPSEASAGKRLFTWSYDTDVASERTLELETWITERIGDHEAGASALWAPVLGVTDRFELSLPLEWAWGVASQTTVFDRYGIDARYRFAASDPLEAGKVVPLVRL